MLIYISPYFFLFPILFFKFIICRNLLPAKVLPGQRAHAAGQGGEGRCGAHAAGQGGEGRCGAYAAGQGGEGRCGAYAAGLGSY